jgi:seryl-tRNA(Sec) selenium transferase
MLAQTAGEINIRAEDFVAKLKETLGANSHLNVELTAGNSVVGGGSAPAIQPPTTLLTLKHEKLSASELEKSLRLSRPPIIARIVEDKVSIDLRTVSGAEEVELLEILRRLATNKHEIHEKEKTNIENKTMKT